MLAALLLPSKGPIWILVSLSAKIAGSGITLPLLTIFKVQDVWSTMGHIKLNTTATLPSTIRLILRSTPLIMKPNKANYALTPSSTLTTRAIIKLTPTLACSSAIGSTKNSILRNTRKSGIPGLNYEWWQPMIIKNIKIFSQNMQKNNLIINTILETRFEFDIIFIQELSWSTICSISNSKSQEGEELVGISNHPNWLVFANKSSNIHDYPRVITYINIRLSSLYFSLYKNILSHKNISIVSLFINNNIFFLINIYSDSLQSALKYLKDTKVSIPNILIIAGMFNIIYCFL